MKYVLLFLLCAVVSFSVIKLSQNTKIPISKSVEKDSNALVSVCKGRSTTEECYGNRFGILTKKEKIEYTLAVLKNVQNKDNKAKNCHFIAHKISQAEVEKNPEDWLGVFGKIDLNACSRGFFHGVIEGHLKDDPDFMLDKKSISSICSSIAQKTGENLSEEQVDSLCAHAVGHILLVQTEGVIDNSVKVCSQLSKYLENPCYDGVFMENTNRENLKLHGISEDLEWNEANTFQIEKLCKKYSGKVGSSCWAGLSDMFGSISEGDSKKLYQLCQNAPDTEERENCYAKGSGFMAFIFAGQGKNSEFATLCNEDLKDSTVRSCIQQVVSYVLNSSISYSDKVLFFCDKFSSSLDNFCYRETYHVLRYNSKSAASTFCNDLPPEKKITCSS